MQSLKSHFILCENVSVLSDICEVAKRVISKGFPKICNLLVVYRFFCMALFHNQDKWNLLYVFEESHKIRDFANIVITFLQYV